MAEPPAFEGASLLWVFPLPYPRCREGWGKSDYPAYITVMTEQFPDDKREGKARTVFHILSAALDPHQSSEFADRATALLENVVAELEGFVEGRVFEADDRKAVILITAWKTRHMWAKAHWNQQVQALIAGYAESGAAFIDAMCYGRPKIAARGR